MVRFQNRFAPLALLCCAMFVSNARAEDVDVVESPASEPRVIITKALESYGFELQDAHTVAVLAADGVLLAEEPQLCLAYLVTIYWCGMEGGQPVNKVMRFRLDASCLDDFQLDALPCLGVLCPLGTKPLLKLQTGAGLCFGIPSSACVFAELSGPVLTTCGLFPDCECLPQLVGGSCLDLIECVPVSAPGSGGTCAPTECPACD